MKKEKVTNSQVIAIVNGLQNTDMKGINDATIYYAIHRTKEKAQPQLKLIADAVNQFKGDKLVELETKYAKEVAEVQTAFLKDKKFYNTAVLESLIEKVYEDSKDGDEIMPLIEAFKTKRNEFMAADCTDFEPHRIKLSHIEGSQIKINETQMGALMPIIDHEN